MLRSWESRPIYQSQKHFRIANVCMSVHQSPKPKTPQPLRIMSICHYAYILISKMFYLISQISQISDLILISKIFSRESDSRITIVHPSVSPLVCPLSIAQNAY